MSSWGSLKGEGVQQKEETWVKLENKLAVNRKLGIRKRKRDECNESECLEFYNLTEKKQGGPCVLLNVIDIYIRMLFLPVSN